MNAPDHTAKIGILCWEEGQVPKGLVQLETLVGNSTNPASYDFPVRFKRVQGANVHTILENPDPAVLRTMIADAQDMASQGVRAISTSCGFNAIFQRELAQALSVPVFTSSLLQVPMAQHMVGTHGQVAILTANAGALRPEHLSAVGITRTDNLHILGLEQCSEWNRMFAEPEAEISLTTIEQEVLGTALQALKAHPAIRAFVLECTDLPPYAAALRQASGLPVFDFVTMMNYLQSSLP